MLRALKYLFSPQSHDPKAHSLYMTAVEQARTPRFYQELGVADTVDGRFDIIVLHLFLITHGLRADGSPQALEVARALAELFFADMDRSLREMGAGDTGVGIRVKNMAQAMYGRAQSYEEALSDPAALEAAVVRNIYRGGEAKGAKPIAEYIRKNAAHLAGDPLKIKEGSLAFISF